MTKAKESFAQSSAEFNLDPKLTEHIETQTDEKVTFKDNSVFEKTGGSIRTKVMSKKHIKTKKIGEITQTEPGLVTHASSTSKLYSLSPQKEYLNRKLNP